MKKESKESSKVISGEVLPGHSGNTHSHAIVRPKRDMSHIQGWGADLDHKDRPGYPMERTPPRLEGVHWDQPCLNRWHLKLQTEDIQE